MDRDHRRQSGLGIGAEEDLAGCCSAPANMSDTDLPQGVGVRSGPLSWKLEPSSVAADTQYQDDAVRTPTSDLPSYIFGASIGRDSGIGLDGERGVYISPKPTLRATSPTHVASLVSASNASSPLHSAYASSASLLSSQADISSAGGVEDHPSEAISDAPSTATKIAQTAPEAPPITNLASFVTADVQPASQLRRDGPHYPSQSFATLQSQYYPPSYKPHPLRTRSSHPSQNTSYSSASSPQSRDRAPIVTGARTAGNTPAQSPGLFSSSTSKYRMAGEHEEDSQYSTPLLHPSHLAAPKELVTLIHHLAVEQFPFISNLATIILIIGD